MIPNRIIMALLFVLLLAGCGPDKDSVTKKDTDIEYKLLNKNTDKKISYNRQVRPILEKRCVVCHGCYDAPCQLKLGSMEGIQRGANPEKVYNASRLSAAQPTRLFVDAHSEDEWRKKGFHSILNNGQKTAENNLRNSVLYKILRMKQINPQPRTGSIDESIDLSLNRAQVCPANKDFDQYAETYPQQGMPFALPNLSDSDYSTLVRWIAQGLPNDREFKLPKSTIKQIDKWEKFLNKNDIKHKLFSRYLYEHLSLGHLHFKGADNREFFRLVRSYTPPAEEIREIPTVRVYDDPGVDKFYYRLRYVKSSIVDKTHSVYELSDRRMARYRQLFIDPQYSISELPSYQPEIASNPIKTFVDLPIQSRYRFLLDDAKFFIEGFIKGPVCRGQVALSVIEDHFWVFFSAPERLVVNRDARYMQAVSDLLNMPAEQGDTLNIFSIYTNYRKRHNQYLEVRADSFQSRRRVNLDESMKSIWDGSGALDSGNRALTIFRHFDSATVKQGMIGDYPETAWVLDYPLLERIHYLLVAGYNVYGNLGHQLNTRLYMDFLRMEGENIFLAWMPIKNRREIMESWYTGLRDNRIYLEQPTRWLNQQVVFGYKTDNPKREFYQKLEQRLITDKSQYDYLNRCFSKACKKIPLSGVDKKIQPLTAIKGESLRDMPELIFIRIKTATQSIPYTLIVDKAYKNISILSDISERDPADDRLTLYKGLLGSYPNLFIDLEESEIPAFIADLQSIKNKKDYEQLLSLYSIRRTDRKFWEIADWFYKQSARLQPLDYGIYDLNRYSGY